jgi:hypothetical protein
MAVHIYNPSDSGGRDEEDYKFKASLGRVSKTLSQNTHKRLHMCSNGKVLASFPRELPSRSP